MELCRRSHRIAALVVIGAVLVVPVPLAVADAKAPETAEARAEVYARLMRAQLAQRRGEFRAAAGEIKRAVELMPDSAEVLVEGALLLQRMGRLQDGEDLARRALQIEPNHVAALTFVADVAASRALRPGRTDAKSRTEALELYGRLIDADADDEEMLRRVISLQLQGGDRPEALATARLLAERKPGDRHAAGLLAQLLLEDGERREALRVLLHYIARHPDDSPLIQLAQELTRELKAWDLVDEVFSEHGELGERAVEAQRLRGEALLQLDRMEPASRALEQVLRSDPTDRAVRFHLARTYRRLGRLGEAGGLMRELATETPADGATHLMLAEILDEQADVDAALNAYNTALRLFVTEVAGAEGTEVRDAIRRRMALLYVGRDQLAAGRRLIDEFERPDEPASLQVRARWGLVADDAVALRQIVRKLKSLGEAGLAALIEAEQLLRAGKAARAEGKFAEALESLGARARVQIAELYLDHDSPERGEAVLRAWIEQEPENADARYYLGSYLYRRERVAEAEAELREAFRLDPEHSAALNYLGYSLAERGERLEEALALIDRAVELDGWNGAYLDSLGWVYFRLGRYDDAREPLEQAARTYPKDPIVLEHLGDLYMEVGETDLALAAWRRALEAGPDDAAGLRTKIGVASVAAGERGGAETRVEPQAPPMMP